MTANHTQFPDSFVAAPTHRLTCYFEDEDELKRALDGLKRLDTDMDDIYILQGEQGVAALDLDGSDHGFFATIMRGLQSLSTANDDIDHIAGNLRSGKIFLAVPAEDEDYRDKVVDVVKAANGEEIRYWGHLFIEEISWDYQRRL